jgi:hypothetical protein
MDVCGLNASATICAPALRTLNIDAPCGGERDWFYFSPWRAPGSAGVLDACGLAGGAATQAGFGAQYKETRFAKQGDRGSKLPRTPHSFNQPEPAAGSQPWLWTAGVPAEVSWSIAANRELARTRLLLTRLLTYLLNYLQALTYVVLCRHCCADGGGYSYRLCPLGQNLTEECFTKMPLQFVKGSQKLRWGGKGSGDELSISATYVSDGVTPPNSMWAMNPIPIGGQQQQGGGGGVSTSFHAPKCKESPRCRQPAAGQPNSPCRCSGSWGPFNLEIVDLLVVPDNLAPGDYVLGWRWGKQLSLHITYDVISGRVLDRQALPAFSLPALPT